MGDTDQFHFAVSVVGHDRPGIVAAVTDILAGEGINLEDSAMDLLRGHFAWTLIVATDTNRVQLESLLAALQSDDLRINVVELPAASSPDHGDPLNCWLTVHGADHPGIVSAITSVCAARGGNLTSLSTRLTGDLYVLAADVSFPSGTMFDKVQSELTAAASSQGVTASLRLTEEDVL